MRGDLAAAASDESVRPELENVIEQLAEKGWKLTEAVHRIWAGERDAASLIVGTGPSSALLVQRILELVDQPSQQEVLASMPPAIQAAFQFDGDAFSKAIEDAFSALPPEEAEHLFEQLQQAGLID